MPKLKTPQELQKEQHERNIETMRRLVQEEELYARMSKAGFEKMYFYLEQEKIVEQYERSIAEATKRREDLLKKLQAEVDAKTKSTSIESPEVNKQLGEDPDNEEPEEIEKTTITNY